MTIYLAKFGYSMDNLGNKNDKLSSQRDLNEVEELGYFLDVPVAQRHYSLGHSTSDVLQICSNLARHYRVLDRKYDEQEF